MKRIVFILLLSCSCIFGQQAGYSPWGKGEKTFFRKLVPDETFKYPGDSTIDITYYKLDLNITYSPEYLQGIVTVGFRIASPSMRNLFLDLQQTLTVDSVFSGSSKIDFTHSNNKLNITLERLHSLNEKAILTIYYQGKPGASGFGSFEFSSHNDQPIIWSLSEPYGASDWFPCKDTPGDKADSSDVWITAPAFFTSVSNGSRIEVRTNKDGTITTKWKNHYPIAQYLISIALTNYTEYDNYFRYSQSDSMIVTHFVYPENMSDNTKSQLDRTVDMLKVYSDRFGLYPFIKEKYGHAQFGWGGGMEHQTITSIGGFDEELVSHELAHQWFGDKITCRNWQNIWLNEGFATYCSGVFIEAAYGRPAYNNYITSNMENAKSASGSIYVRDISTTDEIFNSARSYAKGAAVLHMLRGITGDSLFFRIMRTYANSPSLAYGTAVTEDFQKIAEQIYGSSLDYFFKEWIYGENFPRYQASWQAELTPDKQYRITLIIDQLKNSSPLFFTMPLDVSINYKGGDTTLTLFNNQQHQEFSIIVKGYPTALDIDPANKVMKNLSYLSEGNTSQVENFILEQNYPNPFNTSTKIRYEISPAVFGTKSSIRVSLKLFDILGRLKAVLIDGEESAGSHEFIFDASRFALPSGVYYYQMEVNSFIKANKMILLK